MLILGGCSAPEIRDELPPRPGPPAALEAEARSDGNYLQVEYRFRNEGDAQVVVFNGLPAVDGPGERDIDPNAAYVLDLGDSVAGVYKGMRGAPQPQAGPLFTVRGTLVEPQTTITEIFSVPLPLKLRSPYGGTATPPVPFTALALCLDYAPTAAVNAIPGGDAEHPVYAHDDSTGRPFQKCTPTMSIE
jgi:hypothetical protein